MYLVSRFIPLSPVSRYIGGEFQGGCDIVRGMYEDGSLTEALKDYKGKHTSPEPTFSLIKSSKHRPPNHFIRQAYASRLLGPIVYCRSEASTCWQGLSDDDKTAKCF